jgi:hypothetical protein
MDPDKMSPYTSGSCATACFYPKLVQWNERVAS